MHGALLELVNKGDGEQIQKTKNKSFYTKLRHAIFPGPVLHHLFCNLRKPIPLSYNRNVAMHLTIHFYTFNNPRLIGLQPTVEVVDINPRNKACYIIEKFGGNCLGDRIVP